MERTRPFKLEAVRTLGDTERDEYEEASDLVLGFLSDYQQFEAVRRGYAEYRKSVEYYDKKYSVKPRLNEVVTGDMNHAINRRLRGFFNEFYFFLEYAERKLKRRYGKNSGNARAFKRATSTEFDNSFAYRFVYQLRHYAQHINLPINALSLQSQGFDMVLATTMHHLLVEVDRDKLLNSGFDWRAQDVRPQLEALPAKFELNTYIEEMMECMEKVHVSFVCSTLPDAKRAANVITNLVQETGGRGRPCTYDTGNFPKNPALDKVYRLSTGIRWIPAEIAQLIQAVAEPAVLSRHRKFVVNFRMPSAV